MFERGEGGGDTFCNQRGSPHVRTQVDDLKALNTQQLNQYVSALTGL